MTSLAFFVLLIVLIGAACGIAALMQLQKVKAELYQLKKQLQQAAEPAADHPVAAVPLSPQDTSGLNPLNPLPVMITTHPLPPVTAQAETVSIGFFSAVSSWVEQQLIKRGMVWAGALALALGGVFLAKHSLDSGWLSPALRTATGFLFGVILIAGSEWLHTRSKGHALQNYAPAALSSGGFISLYAAVLVALDWYQLISPGSAFVLLAVIALAASWMSLRQGPVLAAIGIIGAYSVPVLVSTDSGNLLALLAYVSLVTCSSVLVEQQVRRPWLWWLPMTAHWLWLAAAIWIAKADQQWLFWLALCASFILLVWWPVVDFRRMRFALQPHNVRSWWPLRRELILALALLLISCIAAFNHTNVSSFTGLMIFSLLLLSMAASHSKSELLIWLSFVPVLCWMTFKPLAWSDDPYALGSDSLKQHLLLFAMMWLPALAVSVKWPQRLQWSSAMAILPVLVLAISYSQVSSAVQQQVQLLWSSLALLLVLVQSLVALKNHHQAAAFIQMAGANFALTLVFTFWLADAALTLAIAVQLVLLTLLGLRRAMPIPHWLIKLIVAAVLVRLTTAPLLGRYETELMLGLHWSFILYPVVLLCFALSWYWWAATPLKGWLEGALLHLIAVFVTVQTQYWLNGGVVNFDDLNFRTLTIQAFNWLLLAWVYQWRSYKAGNTARLYQAAAAVLVVLVATSHLQLSLAENPFWQSAPLGSVPVFNLLLLLWGLPALLCWLFSKLPLAKTIQKLALSAALLGASLYVIATIRHFWQGSQIVLSLATSVAEQYSYSLVFLIIAVSIVLLAHWQQKISVRKAGFVLLSAVMLKVFIVDLNDLTGVLRALSFIGLGLSLVLLSWLFQRLQSAQQQ
jgi:uncharacterized membrane protein